jgi:hypothetical protein
LFDVVSEREVVRDEMKHVDAAVAISAVALRSSACAHGRH